MLRKKSYRKLRNDQQRSRHPSRILVAFCFMTEYNEITISMLQFQSISFTFVIPIGAVRHLTSL
jgi:hypothetical protein